jgi:hypothetical protein
MTIKSLSQFIKLKLKQSFCQHLGYEAKYETKVNDEPFSIETKVDAKCLNCGVSNADITRRALDRYQGDIGRALYIKALEKIKELEN